MHLPDTRSKIQPLEKLLPLLTDLRRQGKRIVLTNGCFDLLHVGHVRYLAAARDLGDTLIVAVNTDRSVRQLKSPERPLNSESDRAEMVAALSAVDLVTLFDDPSAERIADLVGPDVYVKGGDYSDDPKSDRYPPEGRVVTRRGGQVRIVDLVPGKSTTSLIGRVRALE